MENNSNRSGNNFFSGFLIGALVGAAIVFFLGTKKGRKLLKVISEEGMGSINSILEKAEKTTGLDEIYDEEDEMVSNGKEVIVKKVVEEKPKTRRFFKGAPRRLN